MNSQVRSILDDMLKKYGLNGPTEMRAAYREVVQEIILYGLYRGGFFKKAAFYGGTALRIFHGLDRFSEDLDFSLMLPDESFRLSDYFDELRATLALFDMNFAVEEKNKKEGNIRVAVAKGNTKELVMLFFSNDFEESVSPYEVTRVKFEINVNPPQGAAYELIPKRTPYIHEARLYDMPSMFANKIDAVLSRGWKNRMKGRDLYDYLFFLSKDVPVNMELLKNVMIFSGRADEGLSLTKESLVGMLEKKFAEIDFESAKSDLANFVKDMSVLDDWDAGFFCRVTEKLL
ncbi:MAG: nucleotidyl transferase AbiEii/AbiGii toxin family protein [Clostridia bacterium]|nr:nucleotidyl transferase AbiEii/AbiGii toxin family protein [Clostridia bacterium]